MLFFERQKTQRGEWPTLYRRDLFPQAARTQCWQLVGLAEHECEKVVHSLRHVIGVFELNPAGSPGRSYNARYSYSRELQYFLFNGMSNDTELQNVEYALSALELMISNKYNLSQTAIDEINYRLRLAGVGYKVLAKQIVPVDDDDLAASAIVPVVSLLNHPEFSEAHKYLQQAFADYRGGSEKSLENAIDNAAKAGECLLKHIFDKMSITYGEKDTYMPLIQKAKENGLFPAVDDDKLAPLANALKGLGSLRNREGGHGAPDRKATDRLVRLALNHAASNMLYVAETYLEEHKK